MRAYYTILDLTLSEIQSICFIERGAQYMAAVGEKGSVYILDTESGNIVKPKTQPYQLASPHLYFN